MDPRVNKLQQFFSSKGSPLAPYANSFIAAADKYGLDWRLLPAISGIETSFGKAGTGTAGPFGYGSAKSWGNADRAIDVAARGLSDPKGYYKSARTISQIAPIWAPPGASNDAGGNAGWPAAVRQFFSQLGGDPNAVVRGVAPQTLSQPTGAPSMAPKGSGVASDAARRFAAQRAAMVEDDSLTFEDMDFGSFKQAITATRAAMPQPQASVAAGAGMPAADTGAGGLPLITGNGTQPRLSKWGGPEDHGARALGNWESDLAYDLGGKAGTAVYLPSAGRVVKVGGQAGGPAQFRGYGVTVDFGNGQQAFFKHLGSLGGNVKAGAQLPAGTLLGGLADGTGGGPHLHLGAVNNSLLQRLMAYYLR